jgi:hypothetical protein
VDSSSTSHGQHHIDIIIATRDASKPHTPSTRLLLQHCRDIIAKVYITVVLIDIAVHTTPPPHNIVHMMDTKLRRPLTVQLQGTMPALTVPRHRRWH